MVYTWFAKNAKPVFAHNFASLFINFDESKWIEPGDKRIDGQESARSNMVVNVHCNF